METGGDWPRTSLSSKKPTKLPSSHLPMEFTGGKRICCRFRFEHAHVSQERPELNRSGNRNSLKFRRRWYQPTAKCKKKSDSVCQRIGFVRDSNVSRRYTGRSFTRETQRRSRDWTSCQKPQLVIKGKRTKCNTANYVPIVVPGLSTGSSSSFSSISDIFYRRTP